jgi:TonB-dependent receptor
MGSTFDVSRYFFTITPEHPDFVANPASYPLRSMNFNLNRNRENSGSASTDLRWDTRLGSVPTYLKLGGKLQLRDKTIDTDRDAYAGAGQVTLAQFANDQHYTVQGGYTGFVHGNVNAYTDFAEQNRGSPSVMTADPYTTTYETWRQDRDALETIRAGYLMGGAQLGRLAVTAGARLEQTTTEATRRAVQRQTQTRTVTVGEPTAAERTYTHVLPSIVLRLNATDQLVMRAAWTNTLGRPDYDEFATPGSTSYRLTRGRTDVYDGTVVMGNLDLDPYESSNLDASAEYYFPNGGMMGASMFRKRIDNPIYEWSLTERDVLYEGLQFNELVHTQDRNAGEGMLRGVELSWAQPLIFLPKPFDGLGITANIALIDSDVTVPGREDEDLPFFEQSGRVINFVPYYQRGPLELRVAASYRDEYLTEVGEAAFEDRYIDERLTWDVSGQYRIPGDRFELYAQVRNLTNEPEVGYQGVKSRYDLHVLTGRTVAFGLRARY